MSRTFIQLTDPADRPLWIDPIHHLIVQAHADDHQSPPRTRVLLGDGLDAVVSQPPREVVAALSAVLDSAEVSLSAQTAALVAATRQAATGRWS